LPRDYQLKLKLEIKKRRVRSHNKVRALFAKNKVRFARAKQLWPKK